MAKSKQALGRGLSALIPEIDEVSGDNIVELELERISPNPFQPRKEFTKEEIQELADSIDENGLLQPIVVRKKDDKYEIVYGERRLRAFLELKRTHISAIIKDSVDDADMLLMALVENIQRQNLNEIEEAKAYEALIAKRGFTHEKLAERLGKTRTVVTNIIRLLKLPEAVQKSLISKEISMGHARALLTLENADEIEFLCKEIVKNGYTVRDVENLVKRKDSPGTKPSTAAKSTATKATKEDPNIEEMTEKMRYALGTQVHITYKNGKGKIEIEYYSNEDLTRIQNILLKKTSPNA